MSLKEFKRTLLSCPSTRLPLSTVESVNTQDRKPPKSSLKHQIASIERLAENLECTPSGESLPSLPPLPLPPRRNRNKFESGRVGSSNSSQSWMHFGQHSIPEEQPCSSENQPSRRPPVKRTRLSAYAGLLTIDGFDKVSELMPAESGDNNPTEAPSSAAINGQDREINQTQSQRFHSHDKQKYCAEDELQDDLEEDGPATTTVGDSEAGLFIQSGTDGLYEPLALWPPDGDVSKEDRDIVQVPASINSRLLDHQRVGVKFLYKLYRENRGGVLGDDMGLGKTIQVIAFLAAVLQSGSRSRERDHKMASNQKPVLIICPTSVLRNWEQEFQAWGAFEVAIYHGIHRELVINRLRSCKLEIVLTSFDTFRIHGDCLCIVDWDCVIIDEAHRLKNEKSDLYKVCVKIPTKKRYGLTGTIMQNKIMDLFNVFDWVAPGCLGTREHFREFYDDPLKQGQRISAPEKFIQVAEQRRLHLGKVLQSHLLRREKHETIGHLMMGKEDNVIFCAMSPLQQKVYKRLLASPDFECLIKKDEPCSCGSPLTRAECCYRIAPNGIIWPYLHRESPDGCDSCPYCLILPCLTKLQQVSNHLELIKPNLKDDIEKQKKDESLAEFILGEDAGLVGGTTQDESFLGLSDAQHCGKMKALELLLAHWVTHGDKVLLFSYSVRMLDILDKFMIRKGYCFSRLDGSTPMSVRQSMVDDFNRSPSKQVFLISTRAGGLGLNLVSANRVVIFDPNWNPAQDLQAQDRSFRYGQRRHVTVYRLLAAGSLEELVYSRQIYKQQLFNIAVSGNLEKRYFEGVQDSKGNKGELFGISNLFRDLSDKVFTSEIIDTYDKRALSFHGKGSVSNSETDTDRTLAKEEIIGDHSLAVAVVQETEKVAKQKSKVKENSDDELRHVLKNAGVLYAHRNEDVVNYQARVKAVDNVIRSVVPKDSSVKKENKVRVGRVSKRFVKMTRVNKASHKKTDLGKEEQFAMLAKVKGMDKTGFCEWLLSASEVERQKLLLDFKHGLESI